MEPRRRIASPAVVEGVSGGEESQMPSKHGALSTVDVDDASSLLLPLVSLLLSLVVSTAEEENNCVVLRGRCCWNCT